MMKPSSALESLSSADLLSATRELVQKSRGLEAELLLHLGEVDERKHYLECAFPSMFAFCVEELGFSEDAAYARITVARAARRLPAMVEAVRSGKVHLTGLRMLVPHLTDQNHREVLAQAAGKSKRGVEELVARLSPQPAIPALIRKLPELPAPATVRSAPLAAGELSPIAGPPPGAALARRAVLAPLTEETFKVQFTASRAFRDKLRQAQDLLRHRVPDGDMAAVLERALDLLMEDVKKERFAVGRKVRQAPKEEVGSSRHIPDAIKRAVYERDGGRCTFVDERGRRCGEIGALEFDHVDGFARTHRHDVDGIRPLCRAHNQHAADQVYGRTFMERARAPPESVLNSCREWGDAELVPARVLRGTRPESVCGYANAASGRRRASRLSRHAAKPQAAAKPSWVMPLAR